MDAPRESDRRPSGGIVTVDGPMSGYLHVTIGGAVGRGGVNRSTDVRAIQQLLNIRRSAWSSRPLCVDGMCGPQTLRAIAEAQHRLVGRPRSDGRIDPNGPTLRMLNAMRPVPHAAPLAATTPPPGLPHAVVPVARRPVSLAVPARRAASEPPIEVIDAARQSEQRWHVPASISIAQWILESGEGRHMPPGSNNPFGIKAAAGQPSVTVRTREETRSGRSFHIRAPFRKFATLAEAFEAHGRLLATHRAYAEARRHADDPDAYADALTGRYATDTHYGTLLKTIMRSRELYRYNGSTAVSR